MKRIGDILSRNKTPVVVESGTSYKQVTIRTNYKGVVLRGTQDGETILTKNQFAVSAGQFILSRIDARNGAFGIIPEELEGAIVGRGTRQPASSPPRNFAPKSPCPKSPTPKSPSRFRRAGSGAGWPKLARPSVGWLLIVALPTSPKLPRTDYFHGEALHRRVSESIRGYRVGVHRIFAADASVRRTHGNGGLY
jgi:hypothetical protein